MVWVQKRKNLKVLRGRHNGIVNWHLGIRLGLSVETSHTHTHFVRFALAIICFRINRRSWTDVCEQVAWHKSQIARIAWRLSAIRQDRRTVKNDPFSFLKRPVLALSSSVVIPFFHFLISHCILFFGNAGGQRPYHELNGGFRKNGKSLRVCQSDVRGFAPIWLMMIHCSISLESRLSFPNTAQWK